MIGAQAAVTARMKKCLLGDHNLRTKADPGFPLRSDVALDKAQSKAVVAAMMAAELSLPALDQWAKDSGEFDGLKERVKKEKLLSPAFFRGNT